MTHRPDPGFRLPLSRGSLLLMVFWLLVGSSVWAADQAPYGRIPVRRYDPAVWARNVGPDAVTRQQGNAKELHRRWMAVHQLLGERQMSAKSQALLRSRGLGTALRNAGGDKAATDFQDTLHVLLVRISFATNRDSNLTTISPDGNFMLEPLAEPGPLEIDPPPHNKAFYEAHLAGLSEYYRYQSGGRLHIDGRVLPEDPEASYQVGDVADYGPGSEGFWTYEGLEGLVRDMIQAADAGTQADGSANLGDFDDDDPFTYIIFVHAGSDWQSDINGDSPNDIPTFFVNLGDPEFLTSTDSGTGEVGQLTECSIIPETTNQDGDAGSIAAAFYHEFGHALGLPDVYNTDYMTPNAGIWDLMDSGTNLAVAISDVTDEGDTVTVVVTGAIPPSLGAWDKWFLGWLEMGEVQGENRNYNLPAVQVPRDQYYLYNGPSGVFSVRDAQALRAGPSLREWFLLENRWVPIGPGETPYTNLSFERDEATGVIQYLAGQLPGGAWQNSGLYDYFMPAGGVLVWHVNNDRIEEGLATNTINTGGDGLRLVEADGIQDIGILNAYTLGWYGSVFDPFAGYDYTGATTGFGSLYTEGFPSSRCGDRSWSGVFLEVGPLATNRPSVMNLHGGIAEAQEGYPWTLSPLDAELPQAIAPFSLTPVVLAGGSSILVFGTRPQQGEDSGPNHLMALNLSGFPKWPGQDPAGSVATLPGDLAGPPVAISRTPGETGILWTTNGGTVGLTILDTDAETVWQRDLELELDQAAVVVNDGAGGQAILVPAGGGDVLILDPADGDSRQDPLSGNLGALVGPCKVSPQGTGIAVPAAGGWFQVEFAQGIAGVTFGGDYVAGDPSGQVRTAWFQADTDEDIFFFDEDGELGSWRRSAGEWTPNDLLGLPGIVIGDPAVADLDGDGRNDLILVTPQRIHAVSGSGAALQGWPVLLRDLFPLPDSTRFAGPLVVADGTGDGVNEVYAPTAGGHLMALDARGNLLAGYPVRWGDDSGSGCALGQGYTVDSERILWLVSAGGYAGPPLERTLANGRINGFNLAPVAANLRTSEWLGDGGGAARVGPHGTPAALGSLAPASDQIDTAVLYPNPLGDSPLTVRFYSADQAPAEFWVHNLEGEIVFHTAIATDADVVNEHQVDLPNLASGLYVCRLQFSSSSGRTVRTMTLAVER